MIAIVKQTSGESISAHQTATRSGLELVPRIVRKAGQSAIESYLCFFASLGSKHTGYVYRAATKHFFRWTEDNDLSLTDIRGGHVDKFFSDTPWKASTVSFYFHSLKKLFGHLEADRIIEQSPFRNLKTPQHPTSKKKRSLDDLKTAVRELDNDEEDSEGFRAGMVVMYPIVIGGMDPVAIAGSTGIALEEVNKYVGNLRSNGIWTADGKISVSWDDPESSEALVEIILQVMCAMGHVERISVAEGEAA